MRRGSGGDAALGFVRRETTTMSTDNLPAGGFLGPARPHSITFFPNGTACVGDQYGRQMGEFQVGDHIDTIEALERAGYKLADIPDVMGIPRQERMPWSLENKARRDAAKPAPSEEV
jgi:hypothetical protein